VRGLGDGSGLAVTIASTSGRDINKAGIAPDVVVGLTDAQSLAARARQSWHTSRPQYAKALEVLKQKIATQRGSGAQSMR